MKDLTRLFLLSLFAVLMLFVVPVPVMGADFQKGWDAYDKKDYATALNEWRPLAEQGNSDAQFSLGLMFELGFGVDKNLKIAIEWQLKSALQGYMPALEHLGGIFLKSGDFNTARTLFEPVAKQGNPVAQYNLGLMYGRGHGVKIDHSTAAKWYKLAADQGYAAAQTNLAKMYYLGQGVEQSYDQAFKLNRLAAKQGDLKSVVSLGHLYKDGKGTKQNYQTAKKLYFIAAEEGLIEAQAVLGFLFYDGIIMEQDFVYAYMWWDVAKSQGDKKSEFLRDNVRKKMSSAQIAKAQKLAHECVRKKYKGC